MKRFESLPGDKIIGLSEVKPYVKKIKDKLNCPLEVLDQVFMATLNGVAELLQAMPFSENEFIDDYGFLKRQLALASAVLKTRKAYLYPKNGSGEKIAKEEGQWTFAFFSAALFTDILKIKEDREVQIYKKDGFQLGRWDLLTGSLYEKAVSYEMNWSNNKDDIRNEFLLGVLIGRIIPNIAIRWLSDNKPIYKIWVDSILNPYLKNEITDLIRKAANLAEIRIQVIDRNIQQDTSSINYSDQIFSWLKSINQAEGMYLLNDGLLVLEKPFNDFLKRNRLDANETLNALKKSQIIALNKDNYYHDYISKKFENREIHRGLLFLKEKLPFELSKQKLNTTLVKNI